MTFQRALRLQPFRSLAVFPIALVGSLAAYSQDHESFPTVQAQFLDANNFIVGFASGDEIQVGIWQQGEISELGTISAKLLDVVPGSTADFVVFNAMTRRETVTYIGTGRPLHVRQWDAPLLDGSVGRNLLRYFPGADTIFAEEVLQPSQADSAPLRLVDIAIASPLTANTVTTTEPAPFRFRSLGSVSPTYGVQSDLFLVYEHVLGTDENRHAVALYKIQPLERLAELRVPGPLVNYHRAVDGRLSAIVSDRSADKLLRFTASIDPPTNDEEFLSLEESIDRAEFYDWNGTIALGITEEGLHFITNPDRGNDFVFQTPYRYSSVNLQGDHALFVSDESVDLWRIDPWPPVLVTSINQAVLVDEPQ